MKQKIVQIATIAGDYSTDRGLYALTDAGNLYCIGSDSVWIKVPELPEVENVCFPAPKITAFKVGVTMATNYKLGSQISKCPYKSFEVVLEWKRGWNSVIKNYW